LHRADANPLDWPHGLAPSRSAGSTLSEVEGSVGSGFRTLSDCGPIEQIHNEAPHALGLVTLSGSRVQEDLMYVRQAHSAHEKEVTHGQRQVGHKGRRGDSLLNIS
jgi:hypothetical protein